MNELCLLSNIDDLHRLGEPLVGDFVTSDPTTADTTDFVTHEASLGIRVTYQEISFATHGTVAYFALPGLLRWLDRVVP